MAAKPKNKGGRPTKFTETMQDRMKPLFTKGLTESEVCHAVGIDESTLTKWKQSKPGFFTSLNNWKAGEDENVERCLLQRAKGYEYNEVTKQEAKKGALSADVDDGDITDVAGEEMHTVKVVRKQVAPDVTAQIFWLKNRKPKEWRDSINQVHSGEVRIPDVTIRRDSE